MAKTNTDKAAETTEDFLDDDSNFPDDDNIADLESARESRAKTTSPDDLKQTSLEKWTEEQKIEGLKAYVAQRKERAEIDEKRKAAQKRYTTKIKKIDKESRELLAILDEQGALD